MHLYETIQAQSKDQSDIDREFTQIETNVWEAILRSLEIKKRIKKKKGKNALMNSMDTVYTIESIAIQHDNDPEALDSSMYPIDEEFYEH